LLAIFVASSVALFQPDVKRLLAYSSVSQMGYVALGLSFHSEAGLTGSIVHLFNHAMMKGGLFLVMGCIVFRVGSAQLSDLRGLGRTMPWTMAAFVVGGLSLIGVPGTGGFVSKWFLVSAAFEQGLWQVGALTLLSSLIAVGYIWRVIEAAYFAESEDADQPRNEAPLSLLIPTWVMIGATVVFGLYTRLPVGAAGRAARWLLEVDG
jgi:multicomponent Na+:H+ antiporter subunit D